MAEVNWKRLSSKLDEIGQQVPTYQGTTAPALELDDDVEIPKKLFVTRIKGNPDVLLFKTSRSSPDTVLTVEYGVGLGALIFAGLGYSVRAEDAIERAVMSILRCGVRTGGQCRSQWVALNNALIADGQEPVYEKHVTKKQITRGASVYGEQVLKLAADMRAKAAEDDHWYNQTTPKDVDETLAKFDLESVRNNKSVANQLLNTLFRTNTGENLFWELRSVYSPVYKCYTLREPESGNANENCGSYCFPGEKVTCTVGEIRREKVDQSCRKNLCSKD